MLFVRCMDWRWVSWVSCLIFRLAVLFVLVSMAILRMMVLPCVGRVMTSCCWLMQISLRPRRSPRSCEGVAPLINQCVWKGYENG